MNRYDIENIEPKELLFWFKKICEIPHGSYHEKQLSDWLTKTFKELGCYEVKQYPSGMVLAKLKATPGYEKRKTALLQGHMDMVLAKTTDCPKDLTKEHIDVYYDSEQEWITAQKTSLGADNGGAVAAMLAICANKDIPHGPLEFLLTVNEEDKCGECIIADLQPEDIKAELYINMDGAYVNELLHGSAGCITDKFTNPVTYIPADKKLITFRVELTGLRGGHSGIEVHKPHINAIIFLAEAMLNFINHYRTVANIVSFTGGPVNNAIPIFANADVMVSDDHAGEFEEYIRNCLNVAKKVAQNTEPDANIKITRLEKPAEEMISAKDSYHLYSTIVCAPNGCFTPETSYRCMFSSSNLGFVEITPQTKEFKCDYKIRSFLDKDVERLAHKFTNYMTIMGYPKHEYQCKCSSFVNDIDSNISAQCWIHAYKKITGKDIDVQICPGGLELPEICKKVDGLMPNAISVATTIIKEHSPDEVLPLAEYKIFWATLKEVLKTIN